VFVNLVFVAFPVKKKYKKLQKNNQLQEGEKNQQKKTLSTKHGKNPKENMPLTKNFQANGNC
jgi:hypothetical protein